MRKVGLYIHFPFCKRKCLYCDFPSYDRMEEYMESYLRALKKEIKMRQDSLSKYQIKTIFMGGGTPTLFTGWQLADVLETCYKCFSVLENVEITVEANPGTLDAEKLKILKDSGVNRLSLGLQAWQDRHLKSLGRIHTRDDFLESFFLARETGFQNINVDVMFGLPDQTVDEWLETLNWVCKLGIEHLSAYSLIIENGTPYCSLYQKGILKLPSEDVEREMYYKGIDVLRGYGLHQYEISNFSRPGKQCQHNLIYWENEPYMGFGAGAHSYFEGKRSANRKNIEDYILAIEKNETLEEFSKFIDRKEEMFETVMLGLRLTRGIDKKRFLMRFGRDISFYYGDTIERLKKQNLLIENDRFIRLTKRGMDIQNAVLTVFMD